MRSDSVNRLIAELSSQGRIPTTGYRKTGQRSGDSGNTNRTPETGFGNWRSASDTRNPDLKTAWNQLVWYASTFPFFLCTSSLPFIWLNSEFFETLALDGVFGVDIDADKVCYSGRKQLPSFWPEYYENYYRGRLDSCGFSKMCLF